MAVNQMISPIPALQDSTHLDHKHIDHRQAYIFL